MKLLLISTLTAAALTLSACGSDDKDSTMGDTTDQPSTGGDTGMPTGGNETSMPANGGTTPPVTSSDSALNGTWIRSCGVSDEDDLSEGYEIINLTFNGDTGTSTVYSYSDASCSTPTTQGPQVIALEVSFVFPDGSVTTSLGDAKYIDVTTEGATADGVQVPNATGFTETLYDIYLVTNDGKLYFGNDNELDDSANGDSPETRPQTLETTFFFTRM